MTRLRTLIALAATLAIAAGLAACGGGDSGSSDVNPQKVLDQTFNGKQKVDSAKLDASVDLEVSGSQSGNIQIGISGPIDSSGSGTPKFDLTAKVSGDASGQNLDFEGGAISTGSEGFVTYQGTDYRLEPQQYAQLQKVFASSSGRQQGSGTFPGLRDSLTNVTNEGETEVEGANTIHVSGELDVSKFGDAIRSLAGQGQASGLAPSQSQQLQQALPSLDQLDKVVKSATFDVYSGVDDHILREFDFDLNLAAQQGSSVEIKVQIKLADVNQPQTIAAPSGAKPISVLVQQIAPLLGALGSASTGGASGTPSITPPSGANSAVLKCLQQAQTPADIQACANK